MSLSLAFNTARSSLMATSSLIDASTRNIAGASDPTYSRKIATTTTTADGSARMVSLSRATDLPLYYRMLSATSQTADRQALLDGLNQLETTVGDPESDSSPAAKLGALQNALTQYANSPDEPALASSVLSAAKDLAGTLNSASAAVLDTREDADASMADSVSRINDLLAQFQVQNDAVVKGTVKGLDVTDALDKRDAILSQLSEEMGISVVSRDNNDLVIYTDGGATLFEGTARQVTFSATPVYGSSTVGNAVYVDGVPVTGASATMPLKSGRLVGLTELRDEVAVTYQKQLDEIAGALIDTFREVDQTGGGAPDMAGLFTAGSATLPTGSTDGLAALITINAAADPSQGGSTDTMRDGGMNGAAYVYNADGDASFSDRLSGLITDFGTTRGFDPAANIASTATLGDFASASVSWLEQQRSQASAEADSESALLAKASDALSNSTGVNMDDEYAQQLAYEKSYQASSKLIAIINELFDTLLNSVG